MNQKDLIASISQALAKGDSEKQAYFESDFFTSLQNFSPDDQHHFMERLKTTGNTWGFHTSDPVARRLSRKVQSAILESDSVLMNPEVLGVARQRPVIFLGNHLSFTDANFFDYLLSEAGYDDVASTIAVLAGPKVFTGILRRFASLCFGTIKVAQSSSRASGEALISRRKVAQLAYTTLAAAKERQDRGEHLLIFVEGCRSRSSSMQRVLPAIGRYIEHPDAMIIPFGLWGTERLMPIEDDFLYRSTAMGRMGTPVAASDLRSQSQGNKIIIADTIGYLISDLLPAAYRGVYQSVMKNMKPARELATMLAGAAPEKPGSPHGEKNILLQ